MSSSSSLSPLRPPGTAISVEDCLGLDRGRRAFEMASERGETKHPWVLAAALGRRHCVRDSGLRAATSGAKKT
jgi:hypothetical protein